MINRYATEEDIEKLELNDERATEHLKKTVKNYSFEDLRWAINQLVQDIAEVSEARSMRDMYSDTLLLFSDQQNKRIWLSGFRRVKVFIDEIVTRQS